MHTKTEPNPPTREQLKQFWQLAKSHNLDATAFGRLLEFLPPLAAAAKADSLPPRNEYLNLLGLRKETPFFRSVTSDWAYYPVICPPEVAQHPRRLLEDLGLRWNVWIHVQSSLVGGVREWVEDERKYREIHPPIKATAGVTYRLGLIFGCEFKDRARTNAGIFAEIERRGLRRPPAEVGLHLRKSDHPSLIARANEIRPEECPELDGFSTDFVVMHDPLPDGEGGTHLLELWHQDGRRILDSKNGDPGARYGRHTQFVVLLPDEPTGSGGA